MAMHAESTASGTDDPRDDHQQHRAEQAEREVGAERLEQRRHRDHRGEHDQHVAMAEFDGLPLPRAAKSFDGDERGEREHDDAEHQRKEAGPRQVEAAEIEQRGLPGEHEADDREQRRHDHSAAASGNRARQQPARTSLALNCPCGSTSQIC